MTAVQSLVVGGCVALVVLRRELAETFCRLAAAWRWRASCPAAGVVCGADQPSRPAAGPGRAAHAYLTVQAGDHAAGIVAALYVARGGCYYGLDGVDPWGEDRDARLYAGPWPVVAHPPCSRWCRLAGLVEARWGHKRGDDGGCFAAALAAVRRWGGVLEHPAYSDAWAAFDLPRPPSGGSWVRDIYGGWSCYVEQGRYGHPAKKATWLYAFGVDELPWLRWGQALDVESKALVSWCGNHTKANERRPRVGKARAAATPPEFRDLLLSIARSAAPAAAGTTPDCDLGPGAASPSPAGAPPARRGDPAALGSPRFSTSSPAGRGGDRLGVDNAEEE